MTRDIEMVMTTLSAGVEVAVTMVDHRYLYVGISVDGEEPVCAGFVIRRSPTLGIVCDDGSMFPNTARALDHTFGEGEEEPDEDFVTLAPIIHDLMRR